MSPIQRRRNPARRAPRTAANGKSSDHGSPAAKYVQA
jgi:hypothetical protein